MQLERGDMWSVFGKTDWFLITTNPIVTKDGLAVMGRGIAKQAAERFPTIRRDFGDKLIREGHRDSYEVSTIGFYEGQRVGYFMVKNHWRDPALHEVIQNSVESLLSILGTLSDLEMYPSRVDLNFPGIGNGKLPRSTVLPMLERLPDCVHVWEYENVQG
jgi:hypothetical protein